MAIVQVFDGQTSTGTSEVVQIDRGGPRGTARCVGIHCHGITTGTVLIQFAPPAGSDWITVEDGAKTADFFVVTPVPDGWRVRLNCTVATTVDIDAWIG